MNRINKDADSLRNIDIKDEAPEDGEALVYDSATGKYIPETVGSGGTSPYDATVGSTGADYTDIQAAITGVGGTDIKLLLITDITEDSDIAIPSGAELYIDLSNYTLTMGDYNFTYSGTANVTVRGNGVGSGAEIDMTDTDGEYLFNNSSYTTSIVDLAGFTYDNNATINNGGRISAGVLYTRDMRIELPNTYDICYRGTNIFIDNVEIVGGGTSCRNVLSNGIYKVSNVTFSGTFSTNASYDIIQENNNNSVHTNIVFNLDGVSYTKIRGTWSNVKSIGSNLKLAFGYDDTKISNWDNGGGDIDFVGEDRGQFSNITTTGAFDLDNAAAYNCLFSNCRVTSAVTIGGDRHKFNNCDFIGGVTVNDNAIVNIFTGCQFGADAGGGVLTLTDNNSANNTVVVGCASDAALAGTGTTVEAGNVVY